MAGMPIPEEECLESIEDHAPMVRAAEIARELEPDALTAFIRIGERLLEGRTPLRVYLSTTSQRIARARKAMTELEDARCEITFDWTKDFNEERTLTESELIERAKSDIEGVKLADVVIVLMLEEMRMKGAMIEIGAALAAGVPVIVVEEERCWEHFFGCLVHFTDSLNMAVALAERLVG